MLQRGMRKNIIQNAIKTKKEGDEWMYKYVQ
jgi:hypothetical protein